MIQYLIAAGIGAILGKNARKKKYARGGKVDQATRSSFRYHLDSAGKHLDEADTILSRKGDHQGAYGHLIAAHIDGMGMKNMVRKREGNFYESTPAMKGLLDQYEDVITDLIIHVEDVKDIDGYNPDKALRRIGAAQRILASVEGEHEKKGQRKMARGGRLDEEDIKDELYNMGVDYDDLMENAGMDLNDIQDQYLGYQFDPVTATWSRGYAKGGQTSESAHHEMDALKKGDTIRITRLTDNRRTETPILLTLVRKGRVNKGKRNEQTKFKFENEDGQTFFAYKSDGEKPRFAFGDMGIIVSDDIDFSPKMAHGGQTGRLKKALDVYDDLLKRFGLTDDDVYVSEGYGKISWSDDLNGKMSKGFFKNPETAYEDVNRYLRREYGQGKKMAHGGQVPDHLIDVLSSQTTLTKSALQKFVKDNHLSKDDVVTIVSGIGRGQIEPMDVGTAVLMGIGSSENEELVEFAKSGKASDFARERYDKGGKTQGYNDKLDESLGSRHGSGRTKEQGRKDRRDESEAMERSMGRRKYAAVGSMDKGDRMMAHGGKLDLVHVYEDDGSLFGTGSVESMDGDKVLVRFDSQSVKEFDKDKVRPVMAEGGQIPIPKEVLSGKEFIALAVDKDGKPHMKFSKTFNGALRMAKALDKKFDTGYAVKKFDPFYGTSFFEQGIFIPPSKEFRKGGKTKRKQVSSFDKLAMKVAARYRAEGKSNKEAMEIGRGTAAKVYRQQQAKKGKK